MNAIALSVVIPEDRHLTVDLPPHTPSGEATLVVLTQPPAANGKDLLSLEPNSERERIRAKLRAAGLLSTAHHLKTEEQIAPNPAEVERVWNALFKGKTSDEIIDEDRGPR